MPSSPQQRASDEKSSPQQRASEPRAIFPAATSEWATSNLPRSSHPATQRASGISRNLISRLFAATQVATTILQARRFKLYKNLPLFCESHLVALGRHHGHLLVSLLRHRRSTQPWTRLPIVTSLLLIRLLVAFVSTTSTLCVSLFVVVVVIFVFISLSLSGFKSVFRWGTASDFGGSRS